MSIAIIGNNKLLSLFGGTPGLHYLTPFGPTSDITNVGLAWFVTRDTMNGRSLIPSEVPYRANIMKLKQLGVKYIISVTDAGRVDSSIAINDIMLPNQFIDLVKDRGAPLYGERAYADVSTYWRSYSGGGMDSGPITSSDNWSTIVNDGYPEDQTNHNYHRWFNLGLHRGDTFFGNTGIARVSMSNPVCDNLVNILMRGAKAVTGHTVHRGGTCVSIEGPSLPTAAENGWFKIMGAKIGSEVDMPEARLAREAEIAYATIATVMDDDYGLGMNKRFAESEVIRDTNMANAYAMLQIALPIISTTRPESGAHRALDTGMRCTKGAFSSHTQDRIWPIIQRWWEEN